MCRPVKCKCGKTTWAGCGQHVDSVKAKVPASQWCDGQHGGSGKAGDSAAQSGKGIFARIFGR